MGTGQPETTLTTNRIDSTSWHPLQSPMPRTSTCIIANVAGSGIGGAILSLIVSYFKGQGSK
jgi:hypothetical protein